MEFKLNKKNEKSNVDSTSSHRNLEHDKYQNSNKKSSIFKRETTIDDVLETVGYGVYQIKFILLANIIMITQGIVYSANTFIVPQKTYFQMSSFVAMLSTSFVFLGAFLGNFMNIFISENFSRKQLIVILMSIGCFATLVAALTTYAWVFIITRFVVGYCTGSTSVLICNMLSEVLPIKLRGFFLTLVWGGYDIGYIIVFITAIIFMPNFQITGIAYVNLITFLVYFIIFILIIVYLEDTPRFCILRGKEAEGIKMLENMIDESDSVQYKKEEKQKEKEIEKAKIKEAHKKSEFSVIKEEFIEQSLVGAESNILNPSIAKVSNTQEEANIKEETIQNYEGQSDDNHSSIHTYKRLMYLSENDKNEIIANLKHSSYKEYNISFSEFKRIWKGDYLKTTIVLSIFKFFIGFLIVGNLIAFPYYSNKINIKANKTLQSLITFAVANVLGTLFGGLLVETKTLGRKYTTLIVAIFQIIFCALIVFNQRNIGFYNAALSLCYTIQLSVLTTFSIELYHSRERGAATSLLNSLLGISGFISQFIVIGIVDSGFDIYSFFLVITVILFICTILTPKETAHKPLDLSDTVEKEKKRSF